MKSGPGNPRAGAAVLLLLAFACGKGSADKHGAVPAASGASVSPSASASASAGPAPSVAVLEQPPEPTCRTLRVEGEAKVGDVPLVSGALVDGSEWVTLGKGASVTLKVSNSGREIALAGPALFRACRRGREQVLLAKGKVTAGTGMGARPGAEVLIATPVAGVRYGDADFSLTLDDKKLSVEVRAGQVELDSAGAKPFKSPLHGKDRLTVPLGKPDAVALMARCKEAAETAEATARKVGDRAAPEPLGERAQAHVRARKAARSACTIAAAATGLVADPSASAGLWAEAARWEGLWETIPRRGRGQAPEK
jgi:hypothetical protein